MFDRLFLSIFQLILLIKLFNIPGSEIVIIPVLSAIGLSYFVFGKYIFRDRESKLQKKWLSYISGIIFGISSLGVLFQLMNWKGASTFLLTGVSGTVLVLLTTGYFAWANFREKENARLNLYYKHHFTRSASIAAICMIFYLFPPVQWNAALYQEEPPLIKPSQYQNPTNQQLKTDTNQFSQKKDKKKKRNLIH